MNKYAIHHKPDSNYAFPVAADTLAVVLRVAATDKPDRVEILYNNKYDFTETRYCADMRRCGTDGVFAYYRADITLADKRFAYIFKITERGEVSYFSEDGLSREYDFKLAYYTFFQFPFISGADVLRVADWTEHAVFCQIFVDRFCRGDFDKDDAYINTAWNADIDRYSFTGGDLDGIRQKLPYLCDLGINALYLTPIFLSDSNHKYNIRDYLTVDPQFGDAAKLRELLDAAHDLGMHVVIDAVFNHCDKSHALFADVVEKGRDSEYYDMFMIDGDKPDVQKGNYAHFADCKYMPKWNTDDPATRRYLIDIALRYLRMGFDGLRLDVADEIPHEMWRELRREIKAKYPNAVMIGEVWHENEQWLRGDQFDGVMNYKLQKIAIDFFGSTEISATRAAERMNALLFANTEQANAMSLNFLDDHDTPRFIRFAGGDRDKLLCALCAVVMFPGMPCMFYGTELPLDGGGDPDCRKPFDWTRAERGSKFADDVKAVLGLKRLSSLSSRSAQISAKNGVLEITRGAEGETVTAYFNMSGRAKRLDASGEILFSLNYSDNMLSNNGVVVVKNKIHR